MINQQELRKKIQPSTVNLGALRDGETVAYSIQNNSEFDLLSFTKSCGCVGKIELAPRIVTGDFPAIYKQSNLELYLVDGRYCSKVSGANGERYFDIKTETFVDEARTVEGPFPAHQFVQNITIKFDDGLAEYLITPSGEEVSNDQKTKLTIPIKAWILESK